MTLLIGCGGGSLLKVDAERITSEVALIEADVPACGSAADEAAAGAAMRASALRLRGLVNATRVHAASQRANPAGTDKAGGIGTNGLCGGDIAVDFTHERGVTDYEAILSAFCLETDDGQVVLDGKLVGKETGTPTDSGPMIDSFEFSSDGPLTVTHDGETIQVTITDAKTEYGVPSEFEPGFPTEADPDKTTIGSVSAVFPSGRESFLRKVEIERSGGIDLQIRILAGELGTEGEGFVNVTTVAGQPITAVYNDGTVTGGAVELTGKGGVVEVRQNPDNPNRFDMTLDGEPVEDAIDCTAAEEARREAIVALIQALPIY